jgi:short subunit dehydrogenase
MPTGWTTTDIPDQHGRMALVTGANTGIGFHQALELARKGAHVLLAARDPERGRTARSAILQELPAANVELVRLDLADLESVRHLADQLLDRDHGLDLLINNAGVMAVPQRQTTAQGFELQLGTNHLGHFALTGRLLPALLARPVSRVVTVSSLNHRMGAIRLDDLQSERGYRPAARRGRQHPQRRRPPRLQPHRAAVPRPTAGRRRHLRVGARTPHAAGRPARRSRRAAGAAGRHRPAGPGRRLLRPRRAR